MIFVSTRQMHFVDTSINTPYPESIEAQTQQVMKNLANVPEGIDLTLKNVVSVRIFLAHFYKDHDLMNAVYANYFEPGQRPASTCIGVTGHAKGARVEIDMIVKRF